MSTRADNADRIWESDRRQSRSVRRSSPFGLAERNYWLRVFIRERRGLRRMGSLIVRRRRFLLGVASFTVCAPAVVRASNLMGVSARFQRFCACDPAVADRGRTRPVAARNGAPICRNAVRRRESFSGSRKFRPDPESRSSRKPRSPHCGSCERCSGLEVRRPSRWKICPPKSARVFLRCLDTAPTEGLRPRRRGSPTSLRTNAVFAPFDNPSLSWNMTSARSLDYARG